MDFLSLYFLLSSTCLSFKYGNGMPTQTTALALLSVKSNPSLTFPRHTANIKAPLGVPAFLLFWHPSIISSPELFKEELIDLRIYYINQSVFKKDEMKRLYVPLAIFNSRIKILESLFECIGIPWLTHKGFDCRELLPQTRVLPSSNKLLQQTVGGQETQDSVRNGLTYG